MQALERAKKVNTCYELEFEALKEEKAEFEALKKKASIEESKSAEPEQSVGMKRKRSWNFYLTHYKKIHLHQIRL